VHENRKFVKVYKFGTPTVQLQGTYIMYINM